MTKNDHEWLPTQAVCSTWLRKGPLQKNVLIIAMNEINVTRKGGGRDNICKIYVNVPFKVIFSRDNFGADAMESNPV